MSIFLTEKFSQINLAVDIQKNRKKTFNYVSYSVSNFSRMIYKSFFCCILTIRHLTNIMSSKFIKYFYFKLLNFLNYTYQ